MKMWKAVLIKAIVESVIHKLFTKKGKPKKDDDEQEKEKNDKP